MGYSLNLYGARSDPRLSSEDRTSSPGLIRVPESGRDPVIFCSRWSRSRVNKHRGSKKIYKRKKWVYFSDVRENPYRYIDYIDLYDMF